MALEEDNLPQRPHRKRRLRWGRLVFFIVLLAAVVTAGFWGAVWCYDNLIAPPKVDIVGADSKITADETLNSRINVLLTAALTYCFWALTTATAKQQKANRSVQTP